MEGRVHAVGLPELFGALGQAAGGKICGPAVRLGGRGVLEALADYIYAIAKPRCWFLSSMNQVRGLPSASPTIPSRPLVEKLPMPVTYRCTGEHDWMDPRSGPLRPDAASTALQGAPSVCGYIFIDQPELFENALLDRVAPAAAPQAWPSGTATLAGRKFGHEP